MKRFSPHAIWRQALLACAVCLVAAFVFPAGSAYAAPHEFCVGNHLANSKCSGPHLWPYAVVSHSTDGGWSWVWVWNEQWGSDANSCQSGDCFAEAVVGGEGYGREEMANISGKTYYYVPAWFGKE